MEIVMEAVCAKCGEEMDLFTPRFIVESRCQTVLTGSCCLKSLLGKNTCHANKLTENHLNIQELSSETFASEQEPLNCIFTTQWSRVTWYVQVSVCVHFVVFRKWSMNVVGVCSCGNWSCWGGRGLILGQGWIGGRWWGQCEGKGHCYIHKQRACFDKVKPMLD